MTIDEPNPDVDTTGEEAGEFIDPSAQGDEDEDEGAGEDQLDPSARPSGAPPVA
jgi:hypothetical protein